MKDNGLIFAVLSAGAASALALGALTVTDVASEIAMDMIGDCAEDITEQIETAVKSIIGRE